MKKLLIFLTLLIISSPLKAGAHWEKISSTGPHGLTFYLDTDKIEWLKKGVFVRLLTDYNYSRPEGQSIVSKAVIDIENSKYAILHVALYSQHMQRGVVLENKAIPNPTIGIESIVPNSIFDLLRNKLIHMSHERASR
ncbi:MAG: hypothetical protein HKK67_09230 [Chlorobiaceae bacterium]|nr:hypothetical protein [Chlorobiaceae bacterium]